VADATDCDDGDAAIHPGADEVCGGADEDCDGVVDEDDTADAETWYADGDGDGYGDPATASTACTAPSGSVSDATDCDDTDAGTNPAGVEWCGGGDEDCDGAVDEADATDAASWYADTDADGYGDSAAMTVACAAPSGTVADATDCDDTDGASHPGANELCGGDDEDCDGTVDEDDASDAGTWHADADADGYGDAASSTLACVAPSGTLADGSDCDDTDSAVSPAATEVCLDGVDNDCSGDSGGCELSDGSLANADVIIDIDTPSTSFGHGVWTPGDVDGDGYGDLIVHQAAPVYLRYMTGPYVDEVADSSRWSATFELYSASRVATGDLDGDGYADLAVNDQRTGPTTSTLDIFPGPWSGTYSTADATYSLTEDRYRASNDSSAGDLDGDGLDELIVGCLSCGTSRQGRVFVMFGPPVTGTTFAAASLVFDGTSASQELGAQVEFAPDTNGDGYGDLIIASEVSTGMYVFLGPDVGGGDVTAADAVIESFESQTETLSVGDADGDGLTDLLAGADDTNSMGTTITSYLCLAPWTGTMSITDAWATFAGESSDASLEAVHMLDIDGDGRAEPVITVTRGERGETEVFLEPSGGVVSHADADATFTGERYWDSAMNLPPTPGDLNADGTDDLVIGAPGYDDGDYDGRVYIVHGNGE
jgi:hypothetical protein